MITAQLRLLVHTFFILVFWSGVPLLSQEKFVLVTSPDKVQDVCRRHGLTQIAQASDHSSIFLVSSSGDAGVAADSDVQSFELNRPLAVPELSGAASVSLTQSSTSILDGLPGRTVVNYFGSSVVSNYVDQPATRLIHLTDIQGSTSLTGAGITVAIIDTGVDASHPALRDVVLPGFNFITNTRDASELTDLDPATAAALTQSSTSILDGENLVQLNSSTVAILSQSSTSILDGPPAAFGHGTMTAGLVHLVAPGAKLMPLKAFASDGSSDLFNILRGIYYAADHGANVISMSFEIAQDSSALENAIEYALSNNITIIAAAGNDGQKMLVYPAASGAVIGVGSTDNGDLKSNFTNFGTNAVYVAAPGEGVITTYPGGLYAAGWGTSFSAPLVAGEAALILQARRDAKPEDVRNLISKGQNVQEMGHGRIDLYEALPTKTNSTNSGPRGGDTKNDNDPD